MFIKVEDRNARHDQTFINATKVSRKLWRAVCVPLFFVPRRSPLFAEICMICAAYAVIVTSRPFFKYRGCRLSLAPSLPLHFQWCYSSSFQMIFTATPFSGIFLRLRASIREMEPLLFIFFCCGRVQMIGKSYLLNK